MSRRLVAAVLFSAILGLNFFMYFTNSLSVGFDMVLFAITLLGLLAALTKPVPRRLWLFLAPLGALLAIYVAWIPISNDLQALIHFAGGMAGLAVFMFAFQNANDIVSSQWCRIFTAIIVGAIFAITIRQIFVIPEILSQFLVLNKVEYTDLDRLLNIYKRAWSNNIFTYHMLLAAVVLGACRKPSTQTWICLGTLAIVCVIAYQFDRRSVYILSFLAIFVFVTASYSRKLMSIFKFILPCIYMLTFIVLVLTLTRSNSIFLTELNAISIKYTGRWVTTGRELIWLLILQALDGRAAFGLGGHVTFHSLLDNNWSAHSLFMQVLMQTGYIGMTLTFGWLLGIWALITGGPHGRLQATGVGLFIVIAGHSVTSAFLLQNFIIVAIPCWMALGLICGLLHNKRRAPHLRTQSPTSSLKRNARDHGSRTTRQVVQASSSKPMS